MVYGRMKIVYPGIFFLIGICLCTGFTCADIAPSMTLETHGLATFTSVQSSGLLMQQDSIVWRQSSEVLGANLEEVPVVTIDPGTQELTVAYVWREKPEPPMNVREVQATGSYYENTLADQGRIEYIKTSSIDTGYQPVNRYNIREQKVLGFIGTESGRLTSEESILLDTAGNSVTPVFLAAACPFSLGTTGKCTPQFCNGIAAGSTLDLEQGQVATEASSRFIGPAPGPNWPEESAWPPIPVIEGSSAAAHYEISVEGPSSGIPATGSVEAHVQAHLTDGSGTCPGPGVKGLELIYEEKTTASGSISLFKKSISYESGIGCRACSF